MPGLAPVTGRWAITHAFRRSVRAKLLFMVLSPLVLGVPLLLALVWFFGNAAYERLLTFKIRADLSSAHQYFDRVQQGVGQDVRAIARSHALVSQVGAMPDGLLPEAERLDISQALAAAASRQGLDFLHLLDRDGRIVASSRTLRPGTALHTVRPAVAAALAGAQHTTVELFQADELAAIAPELGTRTWLPLVDTVGAAPDPRRAEDRGMLIHSATPVYDRRGFTAGVLEGGVLLNGNLDFVDNINDIIYREGALPLGSEGTATLFLGDVRIATNVRLFEGRRALGTRVSQQVKRHVLDEGKTWYGTAFVVNDYYVSGYELIVDGNGERIGMLYVGFLETPFRQAKVAAMSVLVGLFLLIGVAGSVFSLRWARGIFKPIERMNEVIARIEAGDPAARSGPVRSEDELGRLAAEFDVLLDLLASKRDELQRWADELDAKVAERTAELEAANASLRQTQRQLVMSEKLAAIGELTAGVAHEINNPIAVMQGNLDVLVDVLGDRAEPVRGEVRLIHGQIERVRQIVTKLLQFARPAEYAGYMERVDVNAAVSDCLLLTRHNLERQCIAVTTELAATTRAEINRSELQQVLINLIVNAVQAMPEHGTLQVRTQDWVEDGQAIGVSIAVRDSGQGIAAEHLPHLFDPFFTTKRGSGTGLGLSISYSLVERYGGHISVDSRPGEGATFTMWLRAEARLQDSASPSTYTTRVRTADA